ncbi:MAG: DEAD/DEAH box helicase [Bacilli bacterium]|nr:DEAD/DEAH box helicase [Bacilli bacterium]
MKNENFKDLGLSSKVLKSIETLGFVEPSKIQKEIIPLIIEGYDVIGKAQTGTGKTLAYAASVLSKTDFKTSTVKVLILVPTRELALQVSEEFETLNKSSYFDVLAVYGGSSIELQLRALKRGVDIVVGTPGRVMDLIDRRALKLDNLETFVLDEADEMLNMGFQEDIEYIFKKTNENKQVLLLSATMPKAISKLASNYMKEDYQNISIEEVSKTSTNVKQFYYLVNDKMRAEAMCRVLDSKSPKSAIVFCQTKRDCDRLLNELSARNYSAEAMHGDIAQNMRIEALNRFKAGSFTYLIATDVAARGIHVDHIDLVINYNLPQDVESYIHRIGRTGRAGSEGEALNFVTPREVRFLKDVERIAKCTIVQKELPSMEEVYQAKFQKLITEAETLTDYEDCMTYVRDMNKEQLMHFAASLLKVTVDKEVGSDFNKQIKIREDRRDMVGKNATRVFLTIGKMDGLKKGSLLDFLKEQTQIRKENFQNIEVLEKFTFVDVDNKVVESFLKKIKNKKYKNRAVRAEKSNKGKK